MVDLDKAAAFRPALGIGEKFEVNVVNRRTVVVAIDKINRRTADAFDRGSLSSIGPVGISIGCAPSSRARAYA